MRQRCPTCGRTQQRSNAQNARYWALVSEIADRLKVDGNSFDATQWHEWFKKRFLGADEFRLPSGETMIVIKSSSDLDEAPFSDYMTKVEAWAMERNVWLPDREGS